MYKELLTLVLCIALASCSHSEYDSGDGSLSYLTADVVLLHTSADRAIVQADMDDGTRLSLSNPFTAAWAAKGDTVYRALLYYDKVADGTSAVKARSASPVPVLHPSHIGEGQQMHTDPVGLESVWTARNGTYVNVSLLLKAGSTSGDDAVQTVGLIDDGLTVGTDGVTTRHLRLYHDQGGVPQYYTVQRFVSIDTRDLGSADRVELTVVTYNGTVTRTIK